MESNLPPSQGVWSKLNKLSSWVKQAEQSSFALFPSRTARSTYHTNNSVALGLWCQATLWKRHSCCMPGRNPTTQGFARGGEREADRERRTCWHGVKLFRQWLTVLVFSWVHNLKVCSQLTESAWGSCKTGATVKCVRLVNGSFTYAYQISYDWTVGPLTLWELVLAIYLNTLHLLTSSLHWAYLLMSSYFLLWLFSGGRRGQRKGDVLIKQFFLCSTTPS